jgi:sugar phosphate isomerase/epimerase
VLRLSFSTGTLYHLPLRTTFSLAHGAGFQGVELVLGPEVGLRGAAYVHRLSQEYSLPVLSVHPPIVPYPGRRRVGRTLPRLLSVAEQVDCDLVVLHTPKTTAPEEAPWTEFLQALSQPRSDVEARISLENAAIFRQSDVDYVLHDVRRLRVFADRYDLPLTFDTSHAGTTDYGLLDAYAICAERVVNVHFSDLGLRQVFPSWSLLHTFFLHHQMPGDGVLPLAEFVRRLVRSGYSGILTLEVSPAAVRAWSLAGIREGLSRAVKWVRRMETEALAQTKSGALAREKVAASALMEDKSA